MLVAKMLQNCNTTGARGRERVKASSKHTRSKIDSKVVGTLFGRRKFYLSRPPPAGPDDQGEAHEELTETLSIGERRRQQDPFKIHACSKQLALTTT